MDFVSFFYALEATRVQKLFRLRRLPILLAFTIKHFQENNDQLLPMDTAVDSLSRFLEDFEGYLEADQAVDPQVTGTIEPAPTNELDYRKLSDQIIRTEWCNEENAFFKRIRRDGREFLRLNPMLAKTVSFVNSLFDDVPPPTQTQFMDWMQKLDSLALDSDRSWESQEQALRAQAAEYTRRADRVAKRKMPELLPDHEFRERVQLIWNGYETINQHFTQLPPRFKALGEELVSKQIEGTISKGDMIGHFIDANQALRNSPEGKSFFGFYNQLLPLNAYSQLGEKIEKVANLCHERGVSLDDFTRGGGVKAFLDMPGHLLSAGQDTFRYISDIAEKVSRFVSERNAYEYRHAARLLRLIKQHGQSLRAFSESEYYEKEMVRIDGPPNISNKMIRTLSRKPSTGIFTSSPIAAIDEKPSDELIRQMLAASCVTRHWTEKRINEALYDRTAITLYEYASMLAIKEGISEIAYLLLIAHDPSTPHEIDPSITDRIGYFFDGRAVVAEVPRIVFRKP